MCVGAVNCRFIREFLANKNILLDAENLGGEHGHIILFSNGDFTVYQRKIGKSRSHQLAVRDKQYWQQAIGFTEYEYWQARG